MCKMAKPAKRPFFFLSLVFLLVCICGLVAHFLADNLDHVGWEMAIEASDFDPPHHDHHEENFLLPGVDMAGVPGGLLMTNSDSTSNNLPHSVSPQLSPPKI